VAGRDVGATREDVHDFVCRGVHCIEGFASDQETSSVPSAFRPSR
jgi:hypothetical protein